MGWIFEVSCDLLEEMLGLKNEGAIMRQMKHCRAEEIAILGRLCPGCDKKRSNYQEEGSEPWREVEEGSEPWQEVLKIVMDYVTVVNQKQ